MITSSPRYFDRFDESATQRWENEGGGLPMSLRTRESETAMEPQLPIPEPGMKDSRHVYAEARIGSTAILPRRA
jgi:hypothetical protein